MVTGGETHISTQEVKRKLGEWAGFKWDPSSGRCTYPNGEVRDFPDFIENMESCFLWLVPRLKLIRIDFQCTGLAPTGDSNEWQVGIVSWSKPTLNPVYGFAESPSEAFCRAVYNLVSGRDGTKDIRVATDQ
jgi:hypothetical protein